MIGKAGLLPHTTIKFLTFVEAVTCTHKLVFFALAKTRDELCGDLKSITLLNNWSSLLFLAKDWEGRTPPTYTNTILTFVDAVTCQHKLDF